MPDDDITTDPTSSAGDAVAKAPRKRAPRKKAVAAETAVTAQAAPAEHAGAAMAAPADGAEPATKTPRKRTPRKAVAPTVPEDKPVTAPPALSGDGDNEPVAPVKRARKAPPIVMFQPPEVGFAAPATPAHAGDATEAAPRRRTRAPRIVVADEVVVQRAVAVDGPGSESSQPDAVEGGDDAEAAKSPRRRRGRRGRGRGREGAEGTAEQPADAAEAATDDAAGPAADGDESEDGPSTRRRRRRRRGGGGDDAAGDDPPRTVTRVREPRSDEVRGLSGSTRLEAKKIRRREGREQSRRRPPVITEAEFLARREAVDRVMLVQEHDDRTQIAVLEDGVLVEHYVTKAQATSYAGNVYFGRVQNVLPSMEAAFVDIGKGRNAVLYAGEVNYDTSALEGRAPRIEQALKSGQEIVVQVTKDPIGQKGARLTSQVSLPGRYMVYVPEGSMTGISRKLPDNERTRLKGILKTLKPEGAGIIVRTAAEGASEEDLAADLTRLKAQWDVIEKTAKKAKAPALLHGEPDLVIRVIRDNFNEDFAKLIVSGAGDYETISDYLEYLAPDLMPRLEKWVEPTPLFDQHRVNEQLLKAMDRKVWLPSGGSLVIDRTEAMTVVDVNTGKFTGKGGNLEETVTKNNLEAAEEIIRQLRLRDIGGIIVVDFIDMVLESNRELVMRRLKECLGRDRTKHQVAEITSLGLLQMTRKRISQGLIEAFSETCEHCSGRGIKVHVEMLGGAPGSGTATPQPARARREPKSKAPAKPRTSILDVAAATIGVRAASPSETPTAAPANAPANGAMARKPAPASVTEDTEDDWAWAAAPLPDLVPDPAANGELPADADGAVPDPAAPEGPAEGAQPKRRRGSRGGRGRSKADGGAAATSDAPVSAS